MSAVLDGPVTEPTMEYLQVLIGERTDDEIPADRLPQTQRAASAWIDQLRKRDALPATEEQVEQIKTLEAKLRLSFDENAYADRAGANRIIFSATKRLNRELFTAERQKADATLDELLGSAPGDVPF